MAIIQPLDFEKIFVVTLAGTPELFSFLAMIFISAMAAYFKMSNMIMLSMLALFGVIMAAYIGGIYVLIILISGLFTFYGISKFIKS